MKNEKLYKIIKIIVLLIIFVGSVLVISKISNKDNMGTTASMSDASFPVVYAKVDGYKVNRMLGYAADMEENYIRDSITPLPEDRNLLIQIDKYNRAIKSISYEIRSMDTTRLVENTKVTDFQDFGETIEAALKIKDLIDADTEYNLTIILQTETDETIRYYTRIIQEEDLYAKEKIQYAIEFHNKTFDKEKAKDLVKYLETNSDGDNSSLQYVNIHSNFNQVTWGNMEVTPITDPSLSIKEIYKDTASLELTYMIKAPNYYQEDEYYNIREIYYIRYTSDRIYLLDYERTMDQIFDSETEAFNGDRINLGIRTDSVEYEENKSGSVAAFVQEGSLYCYNNTNGRFTTVFSFFYDDRTDLRNLYKEHDIRIMDVDENGNIRFLVYGYMNRGKHEGSVGAAVYYYDAGLNTIEEEVFIKSTKPYAILKEDIKELCYNNGRQQMYIMLNDTIYRIDLLSRESIIIETNLKNSSYVINNGFMAWINQNSEEQASTITIMNLETNRKRFIKAEEGQYVIPIGFIEDDFIYGIAKQEDVYYDLKGQLQYPMYMINIEDSSGELLKTYSQPDIYIMETSIDDNLINLIRATKAEGTNQYVSIENDQIVNNSVEAGKRTTLISTVTELKETEWQLKLPQNLTDTTPKLLFPKEELYEEPRVIELERAEESDEESRYYVYAKGKLLNIYTNPEEAIADAYDSYGVVVDNNQHYIWERIKKSTKAQISDIGNTVSDTQSGSLAACLSVILKYEGNNENIVSDLDTKMSAIDILQNNLNQRVLDLTGCSLDAILYYVSIGNPVLAIIDQNTSVIIMGYDEYNTILYNPITGETYKKGLNDSRAWFEEAGNVFISYMQSGDSKME